MSLQNGCGLRVNSTSALMPCSIRYGRDRGGDLISELDELALKVALCLRLVALTEFVGVSMRV